MSSLIAWIMRAIPFGTIIMYGAMGETITEKSGNLNLGVPGIMYLAASPVLPAPTSTKTAWPTPTRCSASSSHWSAPGGFRSGRADLRLPDH